MIMTYKQLSQLSILACVLSSYSPEFATHIESSQHHDVQQVQQDIMKTVCKKVFFEYNNIIENNRKKYHSSEMLDEFIENTTKATAYNLYNQLYDLLYSQSITDYIRNLFSDLLISYIDFDTKSKLEQDEILASLLINYHHKIKQKDVLTLSEVDTEKYTITQSIHAFIQNEIKTFAAFATTSLSSDEVNLIQLKLILAKLSDIASHNE